MFVNNTSYPTLTRENFVNAGLWLMLTGIYAEECFMVEEYAAKISQQTGETKTELIEEWSDAYAVHLHNKEEKERSVLFNQISIDNQMYI